MSARRTTMNIDHALVEQAQAILGTDTATATVHQALHEVLKRFHLDRLLARDFDDLSPADVRTMRTPRDVDRPWGGTADADERDAS